MRYLLPPIRAQPFSKVARNTLRLPLIPTRQVMIIAPPDALTALFAPWAKVYSHSKPLATIVVFLHIAPVIVGGGLAIALDRSTLRLGEDAAARSRHLQEIAVAHRSVIIALMVSLLSGAALLASDLETFLGAPAFWIKMALVVALLANGLVMTRVERRVRAGDTDQWKRLRVASITSLVLWLVVTFLGVALTNAA